MTPSKAATDAITDKDPFAGLVRGRVVHYWPTESEARSAAGPWPAMVTNVENEGKPDQLQGVVTLNVNKPEQTPVGLDPVERMRHVPYSETNTPGTWSWMFTGQGTRYVSNPPAALPQLDEAQK